MSSDQLNEYLSGNALKKYTQYSITNSNTLKKELQAIKKNNIAYDIEEHVIGLSSVAAGIRDNKGKIVGVAAVIGPIARLQPKKLRDIAPLVKKCADDISFDLGWRNHGPS
jgi:DNA-binding IclR family transcriptional regulator